MESIFNSDLLKELISTALVAFIVWSIYKRHVSDFDQKYSTFWPRFWAPAVDELILWPLVTLLPLLIVEYFGNNGLQAEVIIGGAILFHYVYSITLHTQRRYDRQASV